METLVIGAYDVLAILDKVGRSEFMDALILRLQDAFRKGADDSSLRSPARSGFARASHSDALLEWMPHQHGADGLTLKTVSYSPHNVSENDLPTVLGTIVRYNDSAGRLEAIADAVILTAMRTGAASALASTLLADPGSRVLGIVGAGAQAVTQVHALSRRFAFDSVLVFDKVTERAMSLERRAGFTGLRFEVAPVEEIVKSADVICTATSVAPGSGPVLPGSEFLPHLHINAVGSDVRGKRELPDGLLERALIFPDHFEQAMAEGECQYAPKSNIRLDLTQLCAAPAEAVAFRPSTTVFDSTGHALEDYVALDVLIDYARELKIGETADLQHCSADPLDPYCRVSKLAAQRQSTAV
ncbi:ornithine cyclodeaminase family protein [Pseudosporangium ferrugineum]|uniref:Alanine dehydrogenase n=1 Tax=Pseudosporangium ferrugineum TaxID=439699 RepID=A0A2T0R905_9ACTN|nr:ornithine cyclodeaminase family protein [Pseudosporangium ferrugineum]PRY17649.1 alanine dehydrogenase [Pseudosporangium ferrugineum]